MATRLISWQEELIEYCAKNNLGWPSWQDVSDRRGGRTAWSSIVEIQGRQIPAPFWHDGPHAYQAREDAAEKALGILRARFG